MAARHQLGTPGSTCSPRPATTRSPPGGRTNPTPSSRPASSPDLVANTSIDDATAHFLKIIDSLDADPVIIGHSFGGLLAEKLLGQGVGAAAVAIDPAQIKGVLPLPLAQLRSAFPALGNPANLRRSVSLTEGQFRFAIGNAVSEEESNQLYDTLAIPAPVRPLFQAAGANFAVHSEAQVHTGNETRGPLLLISGMEDHTVLDVTTRQPSSSTATPAPSPNCSSSKAGGTP